MTAKTTISIRKLTLTAMFLALGMVLPMAFGQIPRIGSMLLPMHIPVFLCAFICGWPYGVTVAILLPLIRSLLFSRPALYPDAVAIACEMATYALVAGVIYARAKCRNTGMVYLSLAVAMVAGRVVRTVVQLALLNLSDIPFSYSAFFMGTLVAGIPGVILQLLIIPAVMLLFRRMHRSPVPKNKSKEPHR